MGSFISPAPVSDTDILAANAGAAVGAVGTVALLTNYSASVLLPNSVLPGSVLFYANTAASDGGSWVGSNYTSPAGSWRLLGNTGYYGKYSTITQIAKMTSLWVRVA